MDFKITLTEIVDLEAQAGKDMGHGELEIVPATGIVEHGHHGVGRIGMIKWSVNIVPALRHGENELRSAGIVCSGGRLYRECPIIGIIGEE